MYDLNLLWLYSGNDKYIQGIRFGRQTVWRTIGRSLLYYIGGSDQDHPQEKEKQKGKMVVWGGLTNSWEKKWKAKEKRKDVSIWMQNSKE